MLSKFGMEWIYGNKVDRVLWKIYNIDAVIFTLLHQLAPAQSEKFLMVIWSLWKRRNLKLWQQKDKMSTHLIDETSMPTNFIFHQCSLIFPRILLLLWFSFVIAGFLPIMRDPSRTLHVHYVFEHLSIGESICISPFPYAWQC